MESQKKMSEHLLEAAACEALGATTPTESAAYQQELAATGAGDEARRADRELRETVALLASASPYMEPPADLRGKILQATAPVTFKMEDYRRATKEPSRFYKWGFYAAMAFLMAAAYYNLGLQNQVKQQSHAVAALSQQSQERAEALAQTLDPAYQPVIFKDEKGQPYGRAFVNEQTGKAVAIFTENYIGAGGKGQLKLAGADGKQVTFDTVLIPAPASSMSAPMVANGGKKPIELPLVFNHVETDTTAKPRVAGQRIAP